jgi:hypothetical protein
MNIEPANGKARWRILYDIVCETEVGGVITYAQAIEDCKAPSRNSVQGAMIKANLELGRAGKNTVETKENIGWLVLEPNAAVPLIGRQRKKAARADDRHAAKINASQRRRAELVHERRAEVDFEERVAARKAEINGRRRRETRSLAERVAELERNAPKKLRA